jgi:hypothetical protein
MLWLVQGSYLLYLLVFPIHSLRAVCPAYVMLHDLITLIISGAPYIGDGKRCLIFLLLSDIYFSVARYPFLHLNLM